MAKVGAQRAAELTGKSKSTIQRAMKSGKISFEMSESGQRVIDVSELERAYGLISGSANPTSSNETAQEPAQKSIKADVELELAQARNSLEIERLNLQIRLLNEQLDTAKDQIDDLKIQRDQWQKQAQQVLLTSQVSQKQAEERINELREREETRQRLIMQKRQQQQMQSKRIKAGNQNAKDTGGMKKLSDFLKPKKKQSA